MRTLQYAVIPLRRSITLLTGCVVDGIAKAFSLPKVCRDPYSAFFTDLLKSSVLAGAVLPSGCCRDSSRPFFETSRLAACCDLSARFYSFNFFSNYLLVDVNVKGAGSYSEFSTPSGSARTRVSFLLDPPISRSSGRAFCRT